MDILWEEALREYHNYQHKYIHHHIISTIPHAHLVLYVLLCFRMSDYARNRASPMGLNPYGQGGFPRRDGPRGRMGRVQGRRGV